MLHYLGQPVWRRCMSRVLSGRSDPRDFTVVVEDDAGALVAFARGTPHDGTTPGFSGELNKIYVLRQFQGSGARSAPPDASG